MCIIAVKKIGVELPNENVFKNCFYNNDDGAGFMYNKDGKVIIKKGYMTFTAFKIALEDSLREIKDVKNTGMVFHFRITTQGGTKPQNCHPFPISNRDIDLQATYFETDLGIAHNGIIDLTSGYNYGTYDYTLKKYIKKDSHLSDTQLFIRDYLYGIYKLNNKFYESEDGLDLVERLIDSKMAFLSPNGDIKTVGVFNESKGMLYSNYTYSYSSYSRTTRRYNSEYLFDDYDDYAYGYNAYKDYRKNTDDKKDKATGKSKDEEVYEIIVSDSDSTEDIIKSVNLMPLEKECYYWGNSNDYGTVEEYEFYAVDKTGILYGIDKESGVAYQESNGYVYLMDYDGNSIDFDEEKAEIFHDVTVYA